MTATVCWVDLTGSMSESTEASGLVQEFSSEDVQWMHRALELARLGLGSVEPNPMVGCVLVRDDELIGEGYHEQFGEAHAEVNAIRSVHGGTNGAVAYVTLEPCSHHGKTPPCSQALIQSGVSKVVIAQQDPFPQVAGMGIKQLREAGIEVKVGLLEDEAQRLNAPYLKRVLTGLPWMIAKYAMTLDGKIATAQGDSQWISNPASREIVHRIRGRVDGVLVGSNTVQLDDPLLTARPPGLRIPKRLVVDSKLSLGLDSQLVTTAREVPVEVCCGPERDDSQRQRLVDAGVHIREFGSTDATERLLQFLKLQVSENHATNILVEGGAQLLGSLRDCQQLDELHLFIGAQMIGGTDSLSPVAGRGVEKIAEGTQFQVVSTQIVDGDVYVRCEKKSGK